MKTFTPTSKSERLAPEEGHEDRFSMWRYYDWRRSGDHVLITSGVAATVPAPTPAQISAAQAGSGEGGKAWFRGTTTYTITDAEGVALVAAGFSVVEV